jgi:hypothetical protein
VNSHAPPQSTPTGSSIRRKRAAVEEHERRLLRRGPRRAG